MLEHLPQNQLIHTFALYSVSSERDTAGGQLPQFTLLAENVPCCVLQSYARVFDTYSSRDDDSDVNIFFVDYDVYKQITMNSRIVFNETNWRVYGRHDLGFMHKLFRVEVRNAD